MPDQHRPEDARLTDPDPPASAPHEQGGPVPVRADQFPRGHQAQLARVQPATAPAPHAVDPDATDQFQPAQARTDSEANHSSDDEPG